MDKLKQIKKEIETDLQKFKDDISLSILKEELNDIDYLLKNGLDYSNIETIRLNTTNKKLYNYLSEYITENY